MRKKPWSHEDKSAVEKHLSRFITMMKVPGNKACAEAVELKSALQCQSWEAILRVQLYSDEEEEKIKEVNVFCRRPQKGH